MRKLIKVNATILLAFGLMWGTSGMITASGLHINLTDSLPRGIYQETKEPITRGVLVMECLPPNVATLGLQRGWLLPGSCSTGTMPVLKEVVAIAGDRVAVETKYVAVNGEILLGTSSLRLDSQGREIPRVPRAEYVLKEGEVFLLARNIPTSWDGRYTGPALVKDIIATVKPVLTEGER